MLRHRAGLIHLVEARHAKAHAEGVHLRRRQGARHAGGNRRGVHAAAQKGPERHVADESEPRGVVEQRQQLLGSDLLGREVSLGPIGRRQVPVAAGLERLSLRAEQPMPWRQAFDALRQPATEGIVVGEVLGQPHGSTSRETAGCARSARGSDANTMPCRGSSA
jgi:hypothetical protein